MKNYNFDNILNDYALDIYNKNYNELEFAQQANVANYMNDIKNPKWKKVIIDGKESKYSISNIGRVRNDITGFIYPKHKVRDKKYEYICLVMDKVKYKRLIHRLVAEAFIPNPENKPEVNHISGVKTCNWVGNLEWNTRQENANHASKEGLMRVGINKSDSKHTEDQVHKVCKMIEDGKSVKYIHKKLGVNISFIVGILSNGEWKCISKNYNIPKDIKYENEKIAHLICNDLSNNKNIDDISKELNVDKELIDDIRNGRKYIKISNVYNIPNLKKANNIKDNKMHKIRKLIYQGITNTDDIIRLLELPDSKGQKRYINKIKHKEKMEVESSTTIETLR